jgi:peptidoglycan/LPS O-acetylase OafA/YrhL
MPVRGKHGNDTVSHPSLRPWKSIARFPHPHRLDDYGRRRSPPQTSELWDTHSEGKVNRTSNFLSRGIMSATSSLFYIFLMCAFFLEGWALSITLPFHRRANENELRSNRMTPLDGLRGILALSVFCTHAAYYYCFELTGRWDARPSNFYSQMGVFPVSMFFFTTGYLFWAKLIRRPYFAKRSFWLGRLCRLGPAYVAACFCMFLLTAYVSEFHRQTSAGKLGLELASWLAFWSGHDINGVKDSHIWLSVAWTLRYEWMFYLSIPFLGWFALRRRRTFLLLALAVGIPRVLPTLSGFGVFSELWNGLTTYVRFFAHVFDVGILVAMCPQSRLARLAQATTATILSFIAIIITLFVVQPTYGPLESAFLALPFACVCFGNSWCGLLSSRALRFLGRISYSFYLLHLLGLSIVLMVLKKRGMLAEISPFSYWAIAAGCGMGTIVVCAFSYQYLEYPFLNLVKEFPNGPS